MGTENISLSSQKPALIFDFGGVLLDWNPRYLFRNCFNGDQDVVENFLAEVDFYSWNLEQDKGRSFDEGVKALSSIFPKYERIIKAYDENWEESILGPIQSTVDLLLPLKQSGYSLFGLTNWSEEKYKIVEHKYDFFKLFEKILVSGEVKMAKPDPNIFKLILNFIGRPAPECIFIDDSHDNILAAKTLDFKVIHFSSSEKLLSEIKELSSS